LLPVEIRFVFEGTGFTSSTFPIQPDFSQNQPATITLNTGSPQTLRQRKAKAKAKEAKLREGKGGSEIVWWPPGM
jgi:hypothetical protein